MIYVLDTDHLSILERGGSSSLPLQLRLSNVPVEAIITTIVSYEEQMRGWLARMPNAKTVDALVKAYERLEAHVATFAGIQVLSFTPEAGNRLEALRNTRAKIGTMDRRIAAIAGFDIIFWPTSIL